MKVLVASVSTLSGIMLISACGGDDSRDMRGTVIVSYVADGRTDDVPADLAATTIRAVCPGDDGWVGIDGEGTADGHFRIPDVPSGNCFVQVGTTYLWTSRTELDFGYTKPGHESSGELSDAWVTFELENLEAWYATDGLIVYASQTGTWLTALEVGLADGATTTDGMSLPWTGLPQLSSSNGDRIGVVQYKRKASQEGSDYNVATRTFKSDPVDLMSGQDLTVTGSFDVAAKLGSYDFSWVGWEPLRLPDSLSQLGIITVAAQPGGFSTLTLGRAARTFYAATLTPFDDWLLTNVEMANAFRSLWPLFVTYGTTATVETASVDGTVINHLLESTFSAPFEETGARSFEPSLGPVQDVAIDDAPASQPHEMGVMPALTWAPSPLGRADVYRVVVWQVVDGDERYVAQLLTTEIGLVVPPSVLEVGARYIFEISAEAGYVDPESAPFRFLDTMATVPIATAMMDVRL